MYMTSFEGTEYPLSHSSTVPNRTGLQLGLRPRWQYKNNRLAISSDDKFVPLLACYYVDVEPVILKSIKAVIPKHTRGTRFLHLVQAPLKEVSRLIAQFT